MGDADATAGLEKGQRVRVRIRSHQVWGFLVEILGHEGLGASIDGLDTAGWSPVNGRDDYPVGAELDAVILHIWHARPYVFLMIPDDADPSPR